MSESEHDIATKMGFAFSKVVEDYMPIAKEALERQGEGEAVSFGAILKLKVEKGVIVGTFVPKAPNIKPKPIHEENHFVLQLGTGGQLEFVYAGTLKDLQGELKEREALAEAKRAAMEAELGPVVDNVGEDEVPGAGLIN